MLRFEQLGALIQSGGLDELDESQRIDLARRYKRTLDEMDRTLESLRRQLVERAVAAAIRANTTAGGLASPGVTARRRAPELWR